MIALQQPFTGQDLIPSQNDDLTFGLARKWAAGHRQMPFSCEKPCFARERLPFFWLLSCALAVSVVAGLGFSREVSSPSQLIPIGRRGPTHRGSSRREIWGETCRAAPDVLAYIF